MTREGYPVSSGSSPAVSVTEATPQLDLATPSPPTVTQPLIYLHSFTCLPFDKKCFIKERHLVTLPRAQL